VCTSFRDRKLSVSLCEIVVVLWCFKTDTLAIVYQGHRFTFLYFNLIFQSKLVKPLFTNNVQNIVVYASIVLSLLMGFWVLNHLPLIDFRPYKVGNNIQKNANSWRRKKSVVEMVFIYKVGGVDKEFTEKTWWQFRRGCFRWPKDKVIKEGYVPPIHDFTMEKTVLTLREFLEAPKSYWSPLMI
jgi:hypothetical protein